MTIGKRVVVFAVACLTLASLPALTAGAGTTGYATQTVSLQKVESSVGARSLTSDPAGNVYGLGPSGIFVIEANDPTFAPHVIVTASRFEQIGANPLYGDSIAYHDGYLYAAFYSGPPMILQVSLDGTTLTPLGAIPPDGSGPHPTGLAFDAAGNMYITDGDHSTIWRLTPGGGLTALAVFPLWYQQACPAAEFPWGITVSGSTLYWINDQCGSIDSLPTTGGTPTEVFTGALNDTSGFGSGFDARDVGITTDPAGDVFAQVWPLHPNKGNSEVVEIPAATGVPVLLTSSTSTQLPSEVRGGVTWANGFVYVGDSVSSPGVYRFAGGSFGAPAQPTGLLVTRTPSAVNAQWAPVAGALSYTCTLMYGFTTPSTFRVTTTSPSCTFANLAPSTPYGVRVVANGPSGSSTPVTNFAPALESITCAKGSVHRVVTSANPTCPTGWRRA